MATVRRAELADGEPSMTIPNNVTLRQTLENAGIEFIDNNDGGEGVPFRKSRRRK